LALFAPWREAFAFFIPELRHPSEDALPFPRYISVTPKKTNAFLAKTVE
jgi:hypothetical protein